MTTYYVDSAAGSNTAPYDTWAKAALALATIDAIDVAGDTIYVASTHSETTAANTTYAFAGTATSPTRLISADKTSGAPPTTLATGATWSSTTASSLTFNSSTGFYCYGLTFNVGTGASAANFTLSGNNYFESCSIRLGTTTSASIAFGVSTINNCSVKFANVGQLVSGAGAKINGLTLLAGGTSPTAMFGTNSGPMVIRDADLTNASTSLNIWTASSVTGVTSKAINCKLPPSWAGLLTSGSPGANTVLELINVDSTATNYNVRRKTQFGEVFTETTIVRTGGASDLVTPVSSKMVSTATAGTFPLTALVTADMVIWNDQTGSARTATVEFVHDSVTALKDDEIWIEIEYLGSSSTPLGTIARDAKADVLATGANQTSSAVTWTTTGLVNPNKQSASVTFTPQMKGFVYARIYLCKASYTVYVDPTITLS